MNNEPVAWMVERTTGTKGYGDTPYVTILDATQPTYWIENKIPEGYTVIPLYTHPVKELSRMDVYELAIESGFMLSTQYGEAEHKLMPVSDGDTLVKLANAILRKAQEK